MEFGYKNIFVFREGLPGWISAGYPTKVTESLPSVDIPTILPSDLKKMLDSNEDFVLLDLRNAVDAKKFWITHPKKIAITLQDLPERISEVPKGKKLVIIDVNGKRSAVAGRFLHMKGFTDLAKVSGGMAQWVKDGMPTTFAK